MSDTPNTRVTGPWTAKYPQVIKFLDGGGTKVLNLVGPSFTGKSSSMPFLISSIVSEQGVPLLYAVSTNLERERLLAVCADIWRDNGVAVEVFTYRTLSERLQDSLPKDVVVFIDVDPAASTDYVLTWIRLAAGVEHNANFRKRVVAISETEIPSWQRAVFATSAKIDASLMATMRAPERKLVSVDKYTTNPRGLAPVAEMTEGEQFNNAQRIYAGVSLMKLSVLDRFFENPDRGARLLFIGPAAGMAHLLAGIATNGVKIPPLLEIGEDADLQYVDKMVATMAEIPPGGRGILCVHPGVRLSLSHGAKCDFTHVILNGPVKKGVLYHGGWGSLLNYDNDNEYHAEWERQRTLELATQGRDFERGVVYCPKTPLFGGAGVETKKKVPERQLYRQRDLCAFALLCVHLAEECMLDMTELITALDSGGVMDPALWFELTRRLTTASLIHPSNGRLAPGPTKRALFVCKWLPHVRNNVSAARILAGAQVFYTNFRFRRVLIAMAVIIAHDDDHHPLLVPASDVDPEDRERLVGGFFADNSEVVDPKLGYMWCALSAWRWAMDRRISPEAGKVPFAKGTMMVDLRTAAKMFAVADSIARELGMYPDKPTGLNSITPLTTNMVMQLHQELLCCSMDHLHWVTAASGSAWSASRQEPTAVQVLDVVTSRKVGAGPTCQLVMVSAIPREGSFAVSTSPTVMNADKNGRDLVAVPNLTLIPAEAVRRWCQLRISEDSEDRRETPLNIDEMVRSVYPEAA